MPSDTDTLTDQDYAANGAQDAEDFANDPANATEGSDDRSGPENPSHNNRDRKKAAKQEAKDQKKESRAEKKEQKNDKNDPLSQEQRKDKNIGHIPGVGGRLKALRQAGRSQQMQALKTLGKDQIKKELKKMAKEAAKQAAKRALANPYVLAAIAIIIVVIALIMIIMGGGAEADPNAPKLTITKTGPEVAQNGQELPYQITVAYPAQAINIVITDKIPDGTDYIDSSPSAKFDPSTRTATWNLKDYQASPGAILSNVNTTLSIRLRAVKNDLAVINQAEGTVTPYLSAIGGPVTGDIARLLPNPLPADPEGVQAKKTSILAAIAVNKTVYLASAAATGVPWQVFAGIHYREGGAAEGTSLVSGRPIGGNEPDVTEGPGCSSDAPQGIEDGIPEPFSGGCKFSSMLDSGIYGGTLLKQKVDGNLNVFEDLVKALSYYNGGGNANCGRDVPYNGCPRLFIGEDDPYVLNFFDAKHKPMFVIYCFDGVKCDPPPEDGRPGTATVAKWAAQSTN